MASDIVILRLSPRTQYIIIYILHNHLENDLTRSRCKHRLCHQNDTPFIDICQLLDCDIRNEPTLLGKLFFSSTSFPF